MIDKMKKKLNKEARTILKRAKKDCDAISRKTETCRQYFLAIIEGEVAEQEIVNEDQKAI